MKSFFLGTICMYITFSHAQTSVTIADSLFQVGEYQKAIALYQKNTSSPLYDTKIAKAYNALGNHQQALTYYHRAITKNPSLIPTTLAYGKLLLTTKKLKQADSLFLYLTTTYPSNPNFHYHLGITKEQRQDSSYIVSYKTAFSLDSTHQKSCYKVAKYYMQKRKYDLTKTTALRGLSSYPENPQLLSILGQNNFLRSYYDRAIPFFKKLLELGYESGFIHTKIATAYLKTSDYDKAIIHYKKALEFEQKPHLYSQIGSIYGRLNDHTQSLENHKKALKLKNTPVDQELIDIAMAYRHQEQWEKAIQYIKSAIRENPRSQKAHYQMALFADAYYDDPNTKLKYYETFTNTFGEQQHKYMQFMVEKRIEQLQKEIEQQKEK
ncbi:tetratricopeptide repeat protein [Aquimarina hainanensis]|uniref:Tetratricopeptide repeat protein n=1 Tax=Aquimarina hainanensis TaxID=1578017 RepID=A0ABW5N329_9FLAO|nr:tetratricopeptide repeat protein [Aquimarina sp. TRL1]QKX04320.1 tetratricopeptide repeat protein [Aquimarina sp. TRL1]